MDLPNRIERRRSARPRALPGGVESKRPQPIAAGLAALALLFLAACGGSDSRLSLLLVTIDTTRADHIGCYGRAGAGTPNIDALAARGVRFEWAFSPVPITLPSHTTILTGTYPLYHGVRDNGNFQVTPELVSLAEVLKDRGYQTTAFVSAFPLDSSFGLDQGFELYDDQQTQPGQVKKFQVGQRNGSQLLEPTLAWIDRFADDGEFFLWVHFFDPHWPYEAPPPFSQQHRDPYQAEIAYTDDCVGKVLEHLDAAGVLDETLVVLVSDHGEGRGEHEEDTHALLTYNSTMRVPLVIAGPNVSEGVVVPQVVSTVDIMPTLLELMDLPALADLQGSSLVPFWTNPGRASHTAYVESMRPRLHHEWSELQGVAHDGWKYIEATRAEGDPGELFDLGEDPDELVNLVGEHPAVAEDLRQRLEELKRTATPAVPLAAAHELGAEGHELLAKLGYAGDDPTASLDPDAPAPHPVEMMRVLNAFNRAREAIMQGELDTAKLRIEEMAELDPNGPTVHEAWGLYYARLSMQDDSLLDRAIEEFDQALRLKPDRAPIWRALADVYRIREDYVSAIEHQKRVLELSPVTDDIASEYRGLLYLARTKAEQLEEAGDRDGALALWQCLARAEPEDAGYAEALRRLGAAQGG